MLTKEVLRQAYDLLSVTEPFRRWNMPAHDDIKFVVSRERSDVTGYYINRNGQHEIGVSERWVRSTITLLATMAHEMIHLHQRRTCMETRLQHNRAWHLLAKRVSQHHGFDP